MPLPESPPWSLLLLTGLTTCLLSTGCHRDDTGHEHGPKAEHSAEHTPAHSTHGGGPAKVVVSRPLKQEVTVQREYVCRIQSCRNIELRALEQGYLEQVQVKEGQLVEEGAPMFQIQPTVYEAERQRAVAELEAARVEYENTRRLAENQVVSQAELALAKAHLDKAQAELNLAEAHLRFTDIRAPFTGLVDRLQVRRGSLLEEGELLTTLSDNREMWVYFNVPEADYLEYAAEERKEQAVALIMANGEPFKSPGKINAIEAEFDNRTGTILFRADFPNPERLLRHGETGKIRLSKRLKDAVLVPQKATFEVLDHCYVLVIDAEGVVRQQRIRVAESLEDVFIVIEGIGEKDRIIVEGIRQVHSGDKPECVDVEPSEVFGQLKLHAE